MPRYDERTNEINKVIGLKISHMRKICNMTQESFGNMINVSVQQIQKYETGKNRICAAKLLMIANGLGKPIEDFYANMHSSATKGELTLSEKIYNELSKNFLKLRNVKQRIMINDIVKNIVNK